MNTIEPSKNMQKTGLSIFTIILLAAMSINVSATLRDRINEHTVHYQNGSKHISYITQGPLSGPAMIFLHGWPGVAETWKYQLEHFAGLGYYAVAPDMPGYGKSSNDANPTDYSHESIIPGLLAMLESIGRTKVIWIGHDWGAAVASSLVATHPEVVEAMVWLTVPYKTLELGYVEVLPFINRTIYPEDEYPYGQWDYMLYYEEHFERATAVFNSSIDFSIKAIFGAWDGNTSVIGNPAPLSHIRKDGGWFGGIDQAPSGDVIPLDKTTLDQDLYDALINKLEATGFGPPDAYYMNHAQNRAYNLERQKNNGYLDMPCLFVEAKYDTVLDTSNSELLSPMPAYCKDFSFASVDASHWLQLQRPHQVNAVITNWLQHNVTASSCGT